MTSPLAPGNLAFVTVPHIIRELKEPIGPFPEEAIRDAQEQWEAVGPELLREFEDRAAAARDFAQSPDLLPFYAVFLFGQFRETRAFEPLIKMISLPGDLPFDLFDDAITENLKRVLGSVYNGNRSALESVVESDGVNDFVRSAALDTFIVLERSRQMTREEVLEYYRSLFHGRLKREPSFAWDALIGCIAELPAAELLPEARQAFADGLCDEWIAGIDWLEKRLEKSLESLLIEQEETYTQIDDALEALQSRFGFQPEPEAAFNPPKERPALSGPEWTSTPNVPVVRTTPKVGRNDLCPCGSGKKYKKCCLANE